LLVAVALQIPRASLESTLPRELVVRFSKIDGAAEQRIKIWFDTWEMFERQPIQGIGLGSFRSYMSDTLKVTRNVYGIGRGGGVYIPDQPESGYFKVFYESGLLGSAAALLFLLFTSQRFFSLLRSPSIERHLKTEAIAAAAALAVFAITFVTLFTLSESRIAVLFALLMALIWAPTIEERRTMTNAGTGVT